MAQKPSLPKGTRDFFPADVAKRNYITSTISKHFKSFGFQPIETPSFENNTTLLGKYGDEGDRLIFKILNSGDFFSNASAEALEKKDANQLSLEITEKSLRYDLTVPFARFVVQNFNELDFPFKRYQIQPVWRADRPQKGRFREFYQCDADVIGSQSLWQEVEFVQLYDEVFNSLKLKEVVIKINHRKVLFGLAEVIGQPDKLIDFTVALDKLDKIGRDGVEKEMIEKGITPEAVQKIAPIFSATDNFEENLFLLENLLEATAIGKEGVQELRFVHEQVKVLGLNASSLKLEVTLARGLNYYTGCIFEVAAPPSVKLGSIGGGGRYDDLTGIFGLKNMSGVGISFGLDRIYLVIEELNLFPPQVEEYTRVIFINFGDTEAMYALKTMQKLRKEGIRSELYPEAAKMKKQMNYANKRNIPFVVLAGEEEISKHRFTLKNMNLGSQSEVDLIEMLSIVKSQ